MSHARARRAIEVKLDAWADAQGISVAHGAEPFDKPQGALYLHGFLLPASTTSRYLASEAIEYRGVYQISIVTPVNEPVGTPEGVIEQLTALFPVDSELSRAGFDGIVIQPVDQGPTITEPDVYTIPVRFSYLGQAPKEA
ncbi:phage tail terminator-like protein [Pseudomonas abietaniphila]|uniref:phage tail terminator-like protein n=1 Tax=Pseudomonas abietaniphila TaxID=89065 RepID=UPI0007824EAA|nr:phage tail terminator-like protein [Pseudomonas abietaniphila]